MTCSLLLEALGEEEEKEDVHCEEDESLGWIKLSNLKGETLDNWGEENS